MATVKPSDHPTGASPKPRHTAYAAETTGLLVIGLLLLAVTVIRYWHVIHWSLR